MRSWREIFRAATQQEMLFLGACIERARQAERAGMTELSARYIGSLDHCRDQIRALIDDGTRAVEPEPAHRDHGLAFETPVGAERWFEMADDSVGIDADIRRALEQADDEARRAAYRELVAQFHDEPEPDKPDDNEMSSEDDDG